MRGKKRQEGLLLLLRTNVGKCSLRRLRLYSSSPVPVTELSVEFVSSSRDPPARTSARASARLDSLMKLFADNTLKN